jgi:hypothetical protein
MKLTQRGAWLFAISAIGTVGFFAYWLIRLVVLLIIHDSWGVSH